MFELRDCPIHHFICVPKPSRRIEISWQTSERCGARTLSHKEANIRHKLLHPGCRCGMPEFRISLYFSSLARASSIGGIRHP